MSKEDEGALVAVLGIVLGIVGFFLLTYEEVTWLGTYYPYLDAYTI